MKTRISTNKAEILQLNVIPEGRAAWLSYEQHLELKRLFEAVPLPTGEETIDNFDYLALHRFLTEVAGLELAPNEAAIHFNAFALIRRGYQVEFITLEESNSPYRTTPTMKIVFHPHPVAGATPLSLRAYHYP